MGNRRSVLVTGVSTGIGKACALHLDSLGFRVFAGVRRDEDGVALRADASDCLSPVILDVTEEDSIATAIRTITGEAEQPLFGLVNNAGIGIGGVLEATPVEEFRKLLEVNVLGMHAVTKACLSLLRAAAGRIVNIGSSSGFMAGPGMGPYAASKFAVRAMSDSLRIEVMPIGMSVSLVAPGAVESEIWEKSKAYKKKLRAVYDIFARAGDRILDTINPIPALEVARTVEHALTSNKPKFVYVVGKDAKKARTLSKLPRRLFAWMILKHTSQIAEKPLAH